MHSPAVDVNVCSGCGSRPDGSWNVFCYEMKDDCGDPGYQELFYEGMTIKELEEMWSRHNDRIKEQWTGVKVCVDV